MAPSAPACSTSRRRTGAPAHRRDHDPAQAQCRVDHCGQRRLGSRTQYRAKQRQDKLDPDSTEPLFHPALQIARKKINKKRHRHRLRRQRQHGRNLTGHPQRRAEQIPGKLDEPIKHLLEVAGMNWPVTVAISHAVCPLDLRDDLSQPVDAHPVGIEVDDDVVENAVDGGPSHTVRRCQAALQSVDVAGRYVDVVQPTCLHVRTATACPYPATGGFIPQRLHRAPRGLGVALARDLTLADYPADGLHPAGLGRVVGRWWRLAASHTARPRRPLHHMDMAFSTAAFRQSLKCSARGSANARSAA